MNRKEKRKDRYFFTSRYILFFSWYIFFVAKRLTNKLHNKRKKFMIKTNTWEITSFHYSCNKLTPTEGEPHQLFSSEQKLEELAWALQTLGNPPFEF